jgi:signal transduction histidine kinase
MYVNLQDPQVAAKEETIAEMAIRIQELQDELASNVDEQRRHELRAISGALYLLHSGGRWYICFSNV